MCALPDKAIPEMTYYVLSKMLNLYSLILIIIITSVCTLSANEKDYWKMMQDR